jgi:hypothetical protein
VPDVWNELGNREMHKNLVVGKPEGKRLLGGSKCR